MTVILRVVVDGVAVGEILAKPKTFSTGSVGYWASDKVLIEGEKYQVGANIVKVGSKNAAKQGTPQ